MEDEKAWMQDPDAITTWGDSFTDGKQEGTLRLLSQNVSGMMLNEKNTADGSQQRMRRTESGRWAKNSALEADIVMYADVRLQRPKSAEYDTR